MRLAVGASAAVALLALSPPLLANGPLAAAPPPAASPAPPASPSLSMGRAHRGFLMRGARLEDTATLVVKESSDEARYGTAELVGLLRGAADAVAARYPGSRLLVGDLSQQGGGRRRPHLSHRSGRDADVGFYVRDEADLGAAVPAFFGMSRQGWGRYRTVRYRFDAARNWALVEALVTSAEAQVQHIFVAQALRRLVLAQAQAEGASPELYERARGILRQPSSGKPHRTHFHVRVYCSRDDLPDCIDDGPQGSGQRP